MKKKAKTYGECVKRLQAVTSDLATEGAHAVMLMRALLEVTVETARKLQGSTPVDGALDAAAILDVAAMTLQTEANRAAAEAHAALGIRDTQGSELRKTSLTTRRKPKKRTR